MADENTRHGGSSAFVEDGRTLESFHWYSEEEDEAEAEDTGDMTDAEKAARTDEARQMKGLIKK